jgi:hypothetical protein
MTDLRQAKPAPDPATRVRRRRVGIAIPHAPAAPIDRIRDGPGADFLPQ